VHDDVDGNGRLEGADVALFFNRLGWIAANEPVALFDYTGNGRIDFADVIRLFDRL
jgi:PKD repeat protein